MGLLYLYLYLYLVTYDVERPTNFLNTCFLACDKRVSTLMFTSSSVSPAKDLLLTDLFLALCGTELHLFTVLTTRVVL